jgi:hypothetical protein
MEIQTVKTNSLNIQNAPEAPHGFLNLKAA